MTTNRATIRGFYKRHARQALGVSAAVVAALVLGMATKEAEAVVVLPKGSSTPVMGYLVRQDERQVVVRHQLGAVWQETAFARDQIDELIVTVDPKRLEQLSPDQPQLYREYAEELAEKRRDPEARDTAIRLYAIAATLAEPPLRHSCLLGLVSLARSSEEERRFRAAAYLHDPAHDEAILTAVEADVEAKPDEENAKDDARSEIIRAIRLVRQGEGTAAKPIAEKPAVRAALKGKFAKVLTHEDLLAVCTRRPLSDKQLAMLVRAELAIDPALAAVAPAETPAEEALPRWSDAIDKGLAPVPSASLYSLTEFDVRASVYRDGQWVRP